MALGKIGIFSFLIRRTALLLNDSNTISETGKPFPFFTDWKVVYFNGSIVGGHLLLLFMSNCSLVVQVLLFHWKILSFFTTLYSRISRLTAVTIVTFLSSATTTFYDPTASTYLKHAMATSLASAVAFFALTSTTFFALTAAASFASAVAFLALTTARTPLPLNLFHATKPFRQVILLMIPIWDLICAHFHPLLFLSINHSYKYSCF
jgi:hypothetical protein